uniref:Glutaredoxin domain-containing protein n=1 Tax=Strongyloides papillosus TaxID=174720 RepID=A0A0N5BUL4_STREA
MTTEEVPLKVYVSSITANTEIRKHIQRSLMVLESLGVPHKVIDICIRSNEAELEFFKQHIRSDKVSGPQKPPQFFIKGQYIGNYYDFHEAIEGNYLEDFLQLRCDSTREIVESEKENIENGKENVIEKEEKNNVEVKEEKPDDINEEGDDEGEGEDEEEEEEEEEEEKIEEKEEIIETNDAKLNVETEDDDGEGQDTEATFTMGLAPRIAASDDGNEENDEEEEEYEEEEEEYEEEEEEYEEEEEEESRSGTNKTK